MSTEERGNTIVAGKKERVEVVSGAVYNRAVQCKMHLSAYLSVLRVCSQFDWAGLTHAIMQVLDLSPVWGSRHGDK